MEGRQTNMIASGLFFSAILWATFYVGCQVAARLGANSACSRDGYVDYRVTPLFSAYCIAADGKESPLVRQK